MPLAALEALVAGVPWSQPPWAASRAPGRRRRSARPTRQRRPRWPRRSRRYSKTVAPTRPSAPPGARGRTRALQPGAGRPGLRAGVRRRARRSGSTQSGNLAGHVGRGESHRAAATRDVRERWRPRRCWSACSAAYGACCRRALTRPVLASALPARLGPSDWAATTTSTAGAGATAGRARYAARGGRSTMPWRACRLEGSRSTSGRDVRRRAISFAGREAPVSNPITLRPYPGEHVVLTAPPGTLHPTIWVYRRGRLRIRGFEITVATSNGGMRIENSHDIEVVGCEIHHTGHGGLAVFGTGTDSPGARNIQLWGNRFHHNGGYWATEDPYWLVGDHSVYWGGVSRPRRRHRPHGVRWRDRQQRLPRPARRPGAPDRQSGERADRDEQHVLSRLPAEPGRRDGDRVLRRGRPVRHARRARRQQHHRQERELSAISGRGGARSCARTSFATTSPGTTAPGTSTRRTARPRRSSTSSARTSPRAHLASWRRTSSTSGSSARARPSTAPTPAYAPVTDRTGRPRHGRPDLGAYEWWPTELASCPRSTAWRDEAATRQARPRFSVVDPGIQHVGNDRATSSFGPRPDGAPTSSCSSPTTAPPTTPCSASRRFATTGSGFFGSSTPAQRPPETPASRRRGASTSPSSTATTSGCRTFLAEMGTGARRPPRCRLRLHRRLGRRRGRAGVFGERRSCARRRSTTPPSTTRTSSSAA